MSHDSYVLEWVQFDPQALREYTHTETFISREAAIEYASLNAIFTSGEYHKLYGPFEEGYHGHEALMQAFDEVQKNEHGEYLYGEFTKPYCAVISKGKRFLGWFHTLESLTPGYLQSSGLDDAAEASIFMNRHSEDYHYIPDYGKVKATEGRQNV